MKNPLLLDVLAQMQSRYKSWLKENTAASVDDVEEVLAEFLYNSLVTLHRSYGSSNEEIGQFVKVANDYILEQIQLQDYQVRYQSYSKLPEPRRTEALNKLQAEREQTL